jgi:hypothetical protein
LLTENAASIALLSQAAGDEDKDYGYEECVGV